MTVLPLDTLCLDGDNHRPLENLYRAGRCCRLLVGHALPPSLGNLDLQTLVRDYPGAKVRLTDPKHYGRTCCLAEICTPLPENRTGYNECGPRVISSFAATIQLAGLSRKLFRDLFSMPLLSSWQKAAAILWVGGKNPRLHYDGWDNILIQLAGRKRLVLYGPDQTRRIATGNGINGIFAKSQRDGRVGVEGVDDLLYYETWLDPGDAVVIPCGAMHALSGSPDSLSVNCFLAGGPWPRYLRYRLTYFIQLYWREQLSVRMPSDFRRWCLGSTRFRFIGRYLTSADTVPRVFHHRYPAEMSQGDITASPEQAPMSSGSESASASGCSCPARRRMWLPGPYD